MNPDGFFHSHRGKAPTPGGCWKLVSDYFYTAFVSLNPNNFGSEQEYYAKVAALSRVFEQRAVECEQLGTELDKFPAATITELKKHPEYPMSTEIAKRTLDDYEGPKGKELAEIGPSTHDTCIRKAFDSVEALRGEHGIDFRRHMTPNQRQALGKQIASCQAAAAVLADVADTVFLAKMAQAAGQKN